MVLSDTHIPERGGELAQKLYDDVATADLVLHAGDITSVDFFKKLQKKCHQLKAVQGNMDEPQLKKSLHRKEIIKIDALRIGLIHGWGGPRGLEERVLDEFVKEKPDIIVFGHSHQPLHVVKNGIILFNPGSPTDKVFSAVNSYGIITINDTLNAEIIKL